MEQQTNCSNNSLTNVLLCNFFFRRDTELIRKIRRLLFPELSDNRNSLGKTRGEKCQRTRVRTHMKKETLKGTRAVVNHLLWQPTADHNE